MLITYAISKYYTNNSNSGSDSDSNIIKMLKAFHVDKQGNTRPTRFD